MDLDQSLPFTIVSFIMTLLGLILTFVGFFTPRKKSSNKTRDNSNQINGGIHININSPTDNKATQTDATQEIKREEENNQETGTNKQGSLESPRKRYLILGGFFISFLGSFGLGMSARSFLSDTNLNGKASPDSSLPESASEPEPEPEPEPNSNKVLWKMKSFITKDNGVGSIMSKVPQRLKELVCEMSDEKFQITDINEKDLTSDSIVDEVNKGEYECGIPGI